MSQRVAEIIAREISAGGPIPFARFMELALYCPVYGYYEKEGDRIGRSGDFYTSVSVGGLFGELLAFQFARWLRKDIPGGVTSQSEDTGVPNLGQSDGEPGRPVSIAEAGAHNGDLARDILRGLRQTDPALFGRLEYVIVEPSPTRAAWQEKKLSEFKGKVHWVSDLAGLARRGKGEVSGFEGIIFSNELLDAMPIHRLGWDAARQRWFEWGVALQAGGFSWQPIACTVPAPSLPPDLPRVLPPGFVYEACPRAEAWHREAAALLSRGRLVVIDYGLTEEELLVPERRAGTLRSYAAHHPGSDPLQNPGDQDLTAHVNFSAIEQAGLSAGLTTTTFVTQERFLTGVVTETLGQESLFPPWTPGRRLEVQTLIHPSQLGRAFRVLVQSR